MRWERWISAYGMETTPVSAATVTSDSDAPSSSPVKLRRPSCSQRVRTRARRVIWAGFSAMVFASVMAFVVIHLPPAANEPFNATLQPALEVAFGNTWRIAVASIVAFWAGDFVNAYVLARMKVMTQGRWLWARTIGSTIVGQLVDSLVFYPIAFYGIWQTNTMLRVIVFNWCMKVLVEVVCTPLTYLVVGRLKRAEGEDHFDVDTNFTPFSLD